MRRTCQRTCEGRTYEGRWTLYLLALALLALPGCKGCGDSKTLTKSELEEKVAEQKKKKKEEEKDPFEWGRVYSLPNDMERMAPYFKPGHWTEFIAEAWANQNDFAGELVTDPFKITAPWVNEKGQSPEVVPYRLGTSRPALLPKQQKKHLGMVLFVSPGEGGRQIHFRLTPRGSTRSVKEQLINAMRLKSWCYNFVVLATNPTDYQQLLLPRRGLDSFRPGGSGESVQPYYNLRIPKLDRFVPISENSLAWTSTAYMLWDGIDPPLLTTDQQRAMIDWLHWGGQLVISGPDSLDLLKDSFLSPYLPGTADADITLTKDDFRTFNEKWTNQWTIPEQERTVKNPKDKGKTEKGKPQPLTIVQPWSGKKLTPAEDAGVEVLAKSDRADGAPLVLDRRVGLGRIALTAFRLGQKELRLSAWPSFDAFLNGCLLRRPPREFVDSDGSSSGVVVVWRDRTTRFTPRFNPNDGAGPANDPNYSRRVRESMNPELVSRVRYFTRDAKLLDATLKAFAEAESLSEDRRVDSATPGDPKGFVIDDRPPGLGENQFAEPWRGGDEDEPATRQTFNFGAGVAGWSDFNHPSQLVRNSLADAAGIVIPKANYVVGLLAIYLAVLVPLNWLVFRLLNRVEWAWIAAPIITIACTVAVIRFAELDIGFARSRTEIAVVEIQGEYPRAHVTRYTGVYTSLATAYDVEFEDPSSVIQPYSAHSQWEHRDPKNPPFMRDSSTVQFRRDDKQITLTGFDVSSNSTGMLHAEHMLDVGGGIAARQVQGNTYELVNRTKLSLKGVAVLSREGAAWVGDFDAGTKKTVTLAPRASAQATDAKRSAAATAQIEETRQAIAEQETNLNQLLQTIRFRNQEPPQIAQARQEIERLKGVLANLEGGTPGSSGDWFAEREQDQITARARREDVLKARLLVRLAENTDTLADGELRLVAWTNEELPGMEISPRASQTRFANVVVAHLRYDGKLTAGKWELGYRNQDLRSREEVQFRNRQFRPFDEPGMPGEGIDLDGDGAADVPADPAGIPDAAKRFLQRYDRNRDGMLDRLEWSRNSLVPLEELDTDRNGKVSAAELEAYFRKQFASPLPQN